MDYSHTYFQVDVKFICWIKNSFKTRVIVVDLTKLSYLLGTGKKSKYFN